MYDIDRKEKDGSDIVEASYYYIKVPKKHREVFLKFSFFLFLTTLGIFCWSGVYFITKIMAQYL